MVAHEGGKPGQSEGGRRPTGDGPGDAEGRQHRFSARRKVEVVLRLLRGEDIEMLSRELNVPAARISHWRDAFLNAGVAAMKARPQDNPEALRLMAKLGETTMEIELLREKIARMETGRPLRRRRSRR